MIIRKGCIISRPTCTVSNPPSHGIDHLSQSSWYLTSQGNHYRYNHSVYKCWLIFEYNKWLRNTHCWQWVWSDTTVTTKILSIYHLYCINKAFLMLPGYLLYLTFDPDSDITPTLDISGIGIFISNTLSAIQTYFHNNSSKDYVWIKIDLQWQDKLLVGCIYYSPSAAMETTNLYVFTL